VLVLEGKSRQQKLEEKQALLSQIPIEEQVKAYEDEGMDQKEAMKRVAKDRGISKREVYQYLLTLEGK
jgi:16S rRNA (cytidine1402-2'-O)-methyltransferase